jgi:hypothetical protein
MCVFFFMASALLNVGAGSYKYKSLATDKNRKTCSPNREPNRKAQQNYRHYFSIFIYFLMMTVRGERDQKVGASGDQKRGKMMRGALA